MKNVIITGTSRGIGNELALKFANEDHQVLAMSRKICSVLAKHENVTCLSVDLSDAEELKNIEQFLTSTWKQVDIVIHNAGAILLKPFTETSVADFRKIYEVNVFGVVALTQIALPYLKSGSHVVTISSMGGIQGSMKFAGLSAYSSSKGAVITLAELLSEEYKMQGISFNVLALGSVQTEMLAEAFPGYQAPLSAGQMAEYIMDFSIKGNQFFNGKVLQVSSSTP
jgi:NAD(P)-dependent dehydrogenase (short-subunit alcohol dehydrogenase family)